jgi:hypothetical protein
MVVMRVRATSGLSESFECEAAVTNHHPRSCFGNAVLVLLGPDGGAVGPLEAEFAGYEIVDATEEERWQLALAGYHLKGLENCEKGAAYH